MQKEMNVLKRKRRPSWHSWIIRGYVHTRC